MFIDQVAITVTDPVAAASYFADVLEAPVQDRGEGVAVTLGTSELVLSAGRPASGVHHLAFDIPPAGFAAHRRWLQGRVALLAGADGTTEFEGPAGWNSRSVYFPGPDRMVLELIARRERPRPSTRVPEIVSISEVGVAVADPLAAAAALRTGVGVAVLGESSPEFVPVGDHDGLLILVRAGRAWLPRFDVVAQALPVRVVLRASAGARADADPVTVPLGPSAVAVSR